MSLSHRERIQAVLRGERPDRPAIALWRHFPIDDQDPQSLAAAVVSFQRELDLDLVKVTPASSFSIADWGVEDAWEGDPEGTRRYTRRVIRKPSDWTGLKPLSPNRGALARQLKCLQLIRRALGPEVPLLQTVFNPLAQARDLAGEEILIEHLRRFPEAVMQGLEAITASTERFVRACVSLGVDGIFLALQHASFRQMSAQEYETWGRPFDLHVLAASEGTWLNLLHLHGEAVMLREVCDYPVQVINWHDRESGPSLKEGRRLSGKVVCGGWGQWSTMVRGDPERIAREAKDAIAQTQGRGLILGTGCVCPIVTPRANLLAAASAGRHKPRA